MTAEQQCDCSRASRSAQPGEQRVAASKINEIKNNAGKNGVDPWGSGRGVGENVRGKWVVMLNDPAAGGELPAQVKILNGVETGEQRVKQSERGQKPEVDPSTPPSVSFENGWLRSG
jgi:hypothetical protein